MGGAGYALWYDERNPRLIGEYAMTQIAPYGTWRSPISAAMLVSRQVSLNWPQIDGTDIYWVEGRPQEVDETCWYGAQLMARSAMLHQLG